MNEGWWINYRTRRYIELKCRYVDHESALRNPEDQDWLGIPSSVIKGFAQFRPQTDRDALLRFVMKRCPLMRIRGHGGIFTTVEFHSYDRRRVLRRISKWAKRFAAPTTMLNVSNLATGMAIRLTVADLNGFLGDQSKACAIFRHQNRNVRVDKEMIGQ